MSRYDLALLSGASRLPLPTSRATGVTVSTGPRGFQDLSAFLPLTDAQADQLAQTPGLRARLSDGAGVLWEGRVEDLALRNGGVQLGALGDARALDDVLYTALWSDSSVAGWETSASTLGGILNNTIPDRFEIDTNNRLYIAPKKGELLTRKEDFFLMGHILADTASSSVTWAQTDFAALLDYAIGKGVRVGSVSQWANARGVVV